MRPGMLSYSLQCSGKLGELKTGMHARNGSKTGWLKDAAAGGVREGVKGEGPEQGDAETTWSHSTGEKVGGMGSGQIAPEQMSVSVTSPHHIHCCGHGSLCPPQGPDVPMAPGPCSENPAGPLVTPGQVFHRVSSFPLSYPVGGTWRFDAPPDLHKRQIPMQSCQSCGDTDKALNTSSTCYLSYRWEGMAFRSITCNT